MPGAAGPGTSAAAVRNWPASLYRPVAIHHLAGRFQHVLAVVEHDQQLTVRQRPYDGRHRVRGISFRHPQRLGDGGGNQRGIGEGGQLDQLCAIAEAAVSQRRGPQGKPCLAAASGAGQRQHAGGTQALEHRGDLRLAPDQQAHLGGQHAVPLHPVFRHDHPPGRASGMTRPAGIYPVRQMMTAAREAHAPSQRRITLL